MSHLYVLRRFQMAATHAWRTIADAVTVGMPIDLRAFKLNFNHRFIALIQSCENLIVSLLLLDVVTVNSLNDLLTHLFVAFLAQPFFSLVITLFSFGKIELCSTKRAHGLSPFCRFVWR